MWKTLLRLSQPLLMAAACIAITALLVRLGQLDANHPAALKRMNAPIHNWDGLVTGTLKPAPALLSHQQ